MGTFVQITRQEFEDWLDDEGFRGQWKLKPGTGGVYLLKLPHAQNVAIEINSTTGSSSEVMDRGEASMSLRLVSLVSGRVLNKKSMGQSHFARTINWRKNWAVGLDRMRSAYVDAKDFYDNLAAIENYEEYRSDLLELIRSIEGWDNNSFVLSLQEKLSKGGVLTPKQVDALHSMAQPKKAPPKVEVAPAKEEDPLLALLRKLYVAAKNAPDQWTMDFTKSLADQIKAGRTLSPKQSELLTNKFRIYRIDPARTASTRYVLRLAS